MKNVIPQLIAPKVNLGSPDKNTPPHVGCPIAFHEVPLAQNMRHNAIVLAFSLDDMERAAVAAGADLYVTQVVQDRPMNAVRLAFGKESCANDLKLTPSTPELLAQRVKDAHASLVTATRELSDAFRNKAEAEAVGLVSGDSWDELVKAEVDAIVAVDNALSALSHARVDAGVGLESVA